GALSQGQMVSGRSYGFLGEPNALAAQAIFFWPFVVLGIKIKGLSLRDKLRQVMIIVLTLSMRGAVLFLAGSRSAILAFIMQIVFCVTSFSSQGVGTKHPRRVLGLHVGKIVGVGGVVVLLAIGLAQPILQKGGGVENRHDIWHAAYV